MSRPSKQLSYKRVTLCLTEEMDRVVLDFRKTEKYCRCSYTEIIRLLMMEGAKAVQDHYQNSNEKMSAPSPALWA